MYVTCYNCGERGHRAIEWKANKSAVYGRSYGSSGRGHPLTCFNCNKEGHRSVDCPTKKIGSTVKKEPIVGRMSTVIKVGERRKNNVLWGKVNGVERKILVDMGAEVGMIPRALVGEDSEDCGVMYIQGVLGKSVLHNSTKATFEVAGLKMVRVVIIDETDDPDGECIVPLNLGDKSEMLAYTKAVSEANVKVLTRSQAKAEAELDKDGGDAVSTDLWCVVEGEEPEPNGLGIELSALDEREEVKPVQESLGNSVVEEKEEEAVPTALEDLVPIVGKDLELCELAEQIGPVRAGSDGEEFRKAVKEDVSLNEWRELGERKERGFVWKKGVLVKGMYVTWEEF